MGLCPLKTLGQSLCKTDTIVTFSECAFNCVVQIRAKIDGIGADWQTQPNIA